MRNNLIAELIKKGYSADQIPKALALTIGCTERTARNKLSNITDFTFSMMSLTSSIYLNLL